MQLTFKSKRPSMIQFVADSVYTAAFQYMNWLNRGVEIESVDVSSDGKIITVLYSQIG